MNASDEIKNRLGGLPETRQGDSFGRYPRSSAFICA
jgi:hypothetical protein